MLCNKSNRWRFSMPMLLAGLFSAAGIGVVGVIIIMTIYALFKK
jgi:hypothetical protein